MDVSHLKIGHLPDRIQGMVNDHIDNRENPAKIVDWLNEFGPVQLMLARDFNHGKITEEDLEEWRKYRERKSPKAEGLAALCANAVASADQIAATGLNSTKLLLLLSARVAVSLDYMESAPPNAAENACLKTLANIVIRIHECETRATRLAFDRQRLLFEREKYREKMMSEYRKAANREPAGGNGPKKEEPPQEESGVERPARAVSSPTNPATPEPIQSIQASIPPE